MTRRFLLSLFSALPFTDKALSPKIASIKDFGAIADGAIYLSMDTSNIWVKETRTGIGGWKRVVEVRIGTDNTAAIQRAFDAAAPRRHSESKMYAKPEVDSLIAATASLTL